MQLWLGLANSLKLAWHPKIKLLRCAAQPIPHSKPPYLAPPALLSRPLAS